MLEVEESNMVERILTDRDIAEIFAGRDTFDEATLARLAAYIRGDPRLEPQIVGLRRKARDAGLNPVDSSEAYSLALSYCQDLEALLARDDWEDPLEILDPQKLGPGIRQIAYVEMILLAEAQAQRADDPTKIRAVKEKIERANTRFERCYRRLDDFLESVLACDEVIADDVLREMVFRYQRLRKERAAAELEEGDVESAQSAAARVEEQLNQLLETVGWSHPAQVLEHSRASFTTLLRSCHLRLLSAPGEERKRLQGVLEKLQQAVHIAETAKQRRETMQHGKQK